jgi:PAS domain S-box-containing protein
MSVELGDGMALLSREGRPETQGWLRRNTYLLLGAGVWVVVVSAALSMNLTLDQHSMVDLAVAEARMACEALTLIGPSLMARQSHDLGRSGNGIRGHITSLNPVSAKNRPDDWERKALKRLAAGAAETSEVRDIEGRTYLSLMRSLVIEQNCLQCHAGQGYKVGDIRGGLSVNVPMAPIWQAHRLHVQMEVASYGVIWLIGLGTLALATRVLQQRALQREQSEATFRDLFENAPVAYHEINREGILRRVNRAECALLGYEAGDMLWRPAWELVAEADREASRVSIRGKLSGEQALEPAQRRFVRRDGSVLSLELHHVLVRNAKGETSGIRTALLNITARVAAEQAVRESELQFRTLADSGQALIWTSGPDKKCDYFNQVWLDFTGRTLEQELGDGWAEGLHPDHLERCMTTYSNAFDRRERFSMACPLRRYDGEYRWLQNDGSPRYNSAGDFAGYIGHCLDITERKLAEEALRESEEKFRVLADSTPTAIMLYRDDRWIYANRATTTICGYSEEELLAMSFWDIVHPDHKQLVQERGRMRQRGEEPSSRYEFKIIAKDGTEKWVDLSGASTTVQGRPAGIISVMDITERKRAEEETSRSQALLRAVLDGTPDPVFLKDRESRIILANPATLQAVGKPAEQILGKTDREFYDDPEIGRAMMENDRRVMENGLAETMEESVPTSGGVRIFLSTKSPYYDAKGCVIGVIGVARDITERKQAEQRILEHLQELERWRKVTVGREERVIELKSEINRLLARLGEPPRYTEHV